MVIGFIGGFAGALGRRGAMVGVLSMILCTVFSGAPESERTAIITTGLLAIGGLTQLIVGGAVALINTRRHRISRRVVESPEPAIRRLRNHRMTDDLFARHAMRLAIALAVATILAQNIGWPHEYWIPMTVVCMSRLDQDGTTSSVFERTLGTILGIALSFILIDYMGSGQMRFALFAAIGTFLLLAFINVNYPIAVTRITLLVVSLFALYGEPVSNTGPIRIYCTLIAAAITVGASYILLPRDTKIK